MIAFFVKNLDRFNLDLDRFARRDWWEGHFLYVGFLFSFSTNDRRV